MVEYIERKRAIVDACNSLELYPSEYAKLEDALNKIPAADVAQVRHGRWLSWNELHGGNTLAKNVLGVFCSECIRQSDSKTYFCQNCGAKMDLEE